jgi:chitinase
MRALVVPHGRSFASVRLHLLGIGRRFRAFMFAGAACLVITPATAQETINYTYDVHGRLVNVDHGTTGPNAGVTAAYTYDPADNRTQVVVGTNSGASCAGVSYTIASNGAVTEGANSVFTITKAGSTSSSCSVNYATANGTATAGSRYTATSGTLTFSSSQTSQTVGVTTIDDTIVEGTQTFSMSLASPSGASTLGSPASATATINDNDSPPPPPPTCAGVSYAISGASTVEGSPLIFVVTKSGSSSISCSVNYATANGTSVAGTGYTSTSGTLTFTAAQTTANISVTTINHNLSSSITKTMFAVV